MLARKICIAIHMTDTTEEVVRKIFADKIDEPPLAMRHDIDREQLWELADDIKANGLINPITVRPIGERFEVVAGHRRFLACRMIGLLEIACVVRELSDDQLLGVMASENLVRSDVDPVDEAQFILRLSKERNMNVAEISATVRRSQKYVQDRLTVAEMPEYMHEFIKSKELTLGVALALFEIEPDEKRRLWVGMAIEQNITVPRAEHWAYQHRLGTLPGAILTPDDIPGGPPATARVQMFECELDGEKYPMSDMRMIAFSSKYEATIAELARAIREEAAAIDSPPDTKSDGAAIA